MDVLVRNWWALVLRGAAAVVFGVLALAWPGVTLGVLVIIFGIYAIVDGVFAIVAAVRAASAGRRWGALLLEGVASLAAGLVALFVPLAAALGFYILFVAWLFVTGVLEIASALRLRQHIAGEWLLALSGVVSILVGVLLAFNPGAGLVGLVWCIGVYAILFGILLIALGLRLKRHAAVLP